MHISGIENDILNQAKQNEKKNNNIEIFDVPGQMSEIHQTGVVLDIKC
jgi:hypothetical protein